MAAERASFQYRKLLDIRRMTARELSTYYRRLRSHESDIDKPLESSRMKKRLHGLTRLILAIDRVLSGRELVVFGDKRSGNIPAGKVYAASHVGRYDIESAMEAIGEQAYLVMGDPGETYRGFEGFFLDRMQGRICVDTGHEVFGLFMKMRSGQTLAPKELGLYEEYKRDRRICEVTCTRRVAAGDSILIYPEGAWNVTPRLTQALFPGAARIAVNGRGVIIPVGIVRDRKRYTVNIGSEMDVDGAGEADIKGITSELRERISSLVAEIVFSEEQIVPRASMGDARQNELGFIADIMSESENGYTLDIIEKTRYFDPDSPENVLGA